MKKSLSLITLAATATAAIALAACSSPAEDTTATTPAATTSPSATTEPTRAAETASPVGAAVPGETPITLTAGDVVITATLNDTQVSQDFISTLPVTLPWHRSIGIEYITELSAPMTETGPFYADVQPGDIVYYNPMDSITIIYDETSSVPTLTYMGEITSDLAVFDTLPEDVEMTVELG